jgi:hypothetical protein
VYSYFSAGRTPWSGWGSPGYYPMLFIYIFKHAFTFAGETLLNVISLVLFQRHLARKHLLTAHHALAVTRQTALSIKRKPISNQTTRTSQRETDNQLNNESSSPGGRNMANFVLTMSITGFIHNVLLTTFTLYNLNFPKPSFTLKILQFCSAFSSNVRHAVNFFQFFFFNTAFRKETRLFILKLGFFKPARRVEPY